MKVLPTSPKEIAALEEQAAHLMRKWAYGLSVALALGSLLYFFVKLVFL